MISSVLAKHPPKPHTTIAQQLALMQSRGLGITDMERAGEWLRRVGYYRFSGYLKPFQGGNSDDPNRFASGALFRHGVEFYLFDKRLRLALLDALERIEVAARAEIAHHMGAKSPLSHREPALLRYKPQKPQAQAEWLAKHYRSVGRSRDELVRHNWEKYGELPVWAATELWSFDALAQFYRMMKGADQNAVAARLGVDVENGGQVFANWLRGMVFVRNVAAHHGRLWNRGMVWRPVLPGAGKISGFNPPVLPEEKSADRVCGILCVVVFFVRKICPQSGWPGRLRELLASGFPDAPGRSLEEMGFPDGWEEEEFWRGDE